MSKCNDEQWNDEAGIATAPGYYVQMSEPSGQPDAVGNTGKDRDKKPD
jgi:hypothetical protein